MSKGQNQCEFENHHHHNNNNQDTEEITETMSPIPKLMNNETSNILTQTQVNSDDCCKLVKQSGKLLNENPTPAIVLTSDEPDEEKLFDLDSNSSTESICMSNSPRTSYNSLLHWGISMPKDETEYLLNKYNELPGEVLAFELPISCLATDIGHNKTSTLGLKLAGNRDLNQMSVFVCGIRPGSVIDRDGHIEIGDQLLELNNQTLYGLSHLNAAPIIRSVYFEALGGCSSSIFRRSKANGLRFVVQRHPDNINLMAATINQSNEPFSSNRTSRRSSVETTLSIISSPCRKTNKAKRSFELMNLAFGTPQTSLVEQFYSTTLYRGSKGFGLAIMEGSSTNEEGIYVKQIIEGGPAEKDGVLCPGDRIIKVNKRDAINANYDTVLEWIKNSKNELQLQVSRWCFSSQTITQNKNETKRLSAPQLLHTFGLGMKVHDFLSRRPNSSNNFHGRDSVSSGRLSLEPLSETNHLFDMNRLIPLIPSGLRRASSPSISYKHDRHLSPNVQNFPNLSTLSLNILPENNTQENISIVINEHNNLEPKEPPSTRSIVPGVETIIAIKCSETEGFGIGCIGGSETALNVPVVHELYANGAAFKDARLRPGDHILDVNGIPLTGLPFIESMNHLFTAYFVASSNKHKSNESIADNENSNSTINSITDENQFINLTIFRPEQITHKWYDQELIIELTKRIGKGLGICIADRCVYFESNKSSNENNQLQNEENLSNSNKNISSSSNSYGVIVTEIIKGSIAASDGRLQTNDQILSVNGENTEYATSELVGALLKAAQNKVTLKIGRLKNQIPLPAFVSHSFCNS